MRTTLHLDEEAYRIALRHAKARKIGIGRAVSDLILCGSKAEMPVKQTAGLLVFDPPKDFPKITPERVKRLAEEW